MTDEERQELCARLRDREACAFKDCDEAANEIERLAKELEQAKDIIHQMNCDLMERAR